MGHYEHLSLEDRKVIQKRQWARIKKSKIANELHRHPSTIKREIERNICADGFYRATIAHENYLKRKTQKRLCKIDKYNDLKLYILEKILYRWSPDYIAGRLKVEFPDTASMEISYESIYKWIYKEYHTNDILLWQYLPRKRRKRKKREHKKQSRLEMHGKKSIHTRPKEVELKEEVGHWEGDTVEGKNHDGYTVSLLERKTQVYLTALMPDKKSETCIRAMMEAFNDIPNKMIKTITFDNGVEFSGFDIIEELFECDVYFADPYSAWQRGSNERSNGLLRRFFPKGTSFKKIKENELAFAQKRINTMPRKALDYLTPYEVFLDCALQF